MCGICGIFIAGRSDCELRQIVTNMAATLAHRGPDGVGVCGGSGWALGHRRLSIIDLANGFQPMSDERGLTITYNGELYNYRELRCELEALGETFRSQSDTEVVLRAYGRWGEDCLAKFNGMFAFAILSGEGREVFLARDRIGIKPLYYAELPEGGLVFGSEIKAVLASQAVEREADLSLVPYYLVQGYFPREFTPFKNIRQLRPGHWLRLRSGRLKTGCYWCASSRAQETRRVTAEDEAELLHLVRDAVKKQTVADVPVGVLLSGGIDSGIVAASLAQMGTDLKTFTVSVIDDPAYDEADVAREVARRYGAEHHEVTMKPTQALSIWESLIDHFDQPFGDSSLLNTYLVCKAARSMIKVALSGDGGDEQWGGYGNYRRYAQLIAWRRRLPTGPAILGMRAASKLSSGFQPWLAQRLMFYSGLLSVPTADIYRYLDSQTPLTPLRQLCGERLESFLLSGTVPICRNGASNLDRIMLEDLQVFMVDAVLRKVDMMSMAVGLEVRVPLLDHRIVEKSLQLSWRDKVTTSETKVFIRRLFNKELPKRVIQGKKKGFGVPLNTWFRGPLKEPMSDLLLSRTCRERGVLNPGAVQTIIDDHLSGRAENGKLIFSMISLERWLRRYDH